VADELRGLAGGSDFELHRYRVVLRRRTFSGGAPGSGTQTNVDLTLGHRDDEGALQPPRVKIASARMEIQSGGEIRQGDFLIGPLTPRYADDPDAPTFYAGYYGQASLDAPSGLAVAPQGTAGGTTWGYRVIAFHEPTNCSDTSALVTTTTGNATLSDTNFNRLTWSAVSGATLYRVYRESRTLAVAPLSLGFIGETSATSFDDTGLEGDGNLGIPPVLYLQQRTAADEVCLILTGDEGELECTLVKYPSTEKPFSYRIVGRNIAGPSRG